MGNATSKHDEARSGGRKRDSLTRSIFLGTSIVSEAIPIDSDKSVKLFEVHSSSVNSTCVDVSLPFLNDPDTIDGSNEQSRSPDPDTQRTFEFDEDTDDLDKNEVDPELNMMQILHAESPQQSLLLSAPDRCDLHRAPSCGLPDMDDGGTSSLSDKGSSYSESLSSSQTREDATDERQMSEEDEGSDTTDLGLTNEEKETAALQPSKERSDVDDCMQCEVYTMTFGGMYTYTATPSTPSTKVDDSGGKLTDEVEDKPNLKQDVDVQLAGEIIDTPYEVYTMNFGGLYTFTTTTPRDDTTELEEQPNQTGEKLSEREESSLADSMEDKTERQFEPTTPYEMYTVSFGGLHTFTAAEANRPQIPMEIQEQREPLKMDKDSDQMTSNCAICTPHEVHTVTFGGLYAFTAAA